MAHRGRPTANEILLDRGIRHATFIERFKNQAVNDALRLLNRDVIPDLLKQISNTDLTPRARKRLQDLLITTRAIVAAGHKDMNKQVTSLLREFGIMEADFQRRLIQRTIGFDIDLKSPSAATLRALVTNEPMEGALLREWFRDQGNRMQSRISRELKIGLQNGETITQITNRFRGLSSEFNKDRNGIRSIVRTAVNHTSNFSREQVFIENQDVIKGVQWVSTLDSKTTVICAGLDGRVFKPGQGIRPPAHFACRSTTVPVLRSFTELGIKGLGELPPATRASASEKFTGQVPARRTFGTWLKDQRLKTQIEVLGSREKAQLFRSGRIDIQSFTDANQKPLTIAQIRRREGIPAPKKRETAGAI